MLIVQFANLLNASFIAKHRNYVSALRCVKDVMFLVTSFDQVNLASIFSSTTQLNGLVKDFDFEFCYNLFVEWEFS
jgi:predicted RNA-binding protein